MKNRLIDLTEMPKGKRYEDVYGRYLEVFEEVAQNSKIKVVNPPNCWIPLLFYLGADISGVQFYFEEDHWFFNNPFFKKEFCQKNRLFIEVISTCRPELVDALWKSDIQWNVLLGGQAVIEQEFSVTNNGSFHRKEVRGYMSVLHVYTPPTENVVLVPCAADKPYPAPLHKKALDVLPNNYYLANATGVLGIVPMELWNIMPYYDSGIPNEWRLFQIAKDYFYRNKHKRIVCYLDYYSLPLYYAFKELQQLPNVIFINEIKFYHEYTDLMESGRLHELKKCLQDFEGYKRKKETFI